MSSADPDARVWPSKGTLEVRGVQMRYRPRLPSVLRSVSLSVRPFPLYLNPHSLHPPVYRSRKSTGCP